MPFDEGFQAITSIADWYALVGEQDRNEATTRLQIIDRLLFDALEWSRTDCIAEEHLDGQYTDYSLGNPGKVLVLEAKREGEYFLLPAGEGTAVVGIAALCGGNPKLEAAITQTSGYCMNRGIPIGVVCNGHQLVAFLGSRSDGVPPLRGKAMVFRSLHDMQDKFLSLWNSLSPSGIEQGHLERQLAGPDHPPPPPKLSRQLRNFPGSQRRNEFESELSILGEIFLQDIVREKEFEEDFLRNCYCSSGALSQYALISKSILRQRYSSLTDDSTLEVSSAQNKSEVTPELLEAAMARSITRRPVILVGDVGVGKSTFLAHLIKIDAKDELGGNIVCYLDFGSGPSLRTDIQSYAAEKIEHELLQTFGIDIQENSFVRGVYHGEIERFKRGIWKPLLESDPGAYKDRELEMLGQLLGDC